MLVVYDHMRLLLFCRPHMLPILKPLLCLLGVFVRSRRIRSGEMRYGIFGVAPIYVAHLDMAQFYRVSRNCSILDYA